MRRPDPPNEIIRCVVRVSVYCQLQTNGRCQQRYLCSLNVVPNQGGRHSGVIAYLIEPVLLQAIAPLTKDPPVPGVVHLRSYSTDEMNGARHKIEIADAQRGKAKLHDGWECFIIRTTRCIRDGTRGYRRVIHQHLK